MGASHPAFALAERVTGFHNQLVVHAPVLVALEEVDLPVGPRESGVGVGRDSSEEARNGFGVNAEVVVGHFVPLPVS